MKMLNATRLQSIEVLCSTRSFIVTVNPTWFFLTGFQTDSVSSLELFQDKSFNKIKVYNIYCFNQWNLLI